MKLHVFLLKIEQRLSQTELYSELFGQWGVGAENCSEFQIANLSGLKLAL